MKKAPRHPTKKRPNSAKAQKSVSHVRPSHEENVARKEAKQLQNFSVKFLAHLIAILFLVGIGFITHFILRGLFGDPKIFDLIPVRYAIEVGDVAIIMALVVKFVRDLLR